MTPTLDTLPDDPEVWDHSATYRNGASDVSLTVRYPDGTTVPVAVPRDTTARQQTRAIIALGDGYTVTGALRTTGGVSSTRTLTTGDVL